MVSIIIPCYNYAHYLSETLNELLAQSYADWECILVDDGSTDDTGKIAAAYCSNDSRFRYVFQPNQGVSAARNHGLALAKGEFIQFLDGDDLLESRKLEIHVNAFAHLPKADIIYGEVRFFDDHQPDKKRISLKGNKPENWMPRLDGAGKIPVSLFCSINFMVIHAPLIRKRLIDRIGVFDTSMKALEDWDFWMRCALGNAYFHFHTADDAFALVRVHEGSLSTDRSAMLPGHFLFLKRTLAHRNLNGKFVMILLVKYVELFWDSVLRYGYLELKAPALALLSLASFPLYLMVKLVRILK